MDYSPPTPILSPYPVTVEQTKEVTNYSRIRYIAYATILTAFRELR